MKDSKDMLDCNNKNIVIKGIYKNIPNNIDTCLFAILFY
ncbi:hypothetical protein XSR1_10042 [Xenorhabdus szentirmaii DSM 16338]|uniref:Uncharacterized protein n=1 Tax=Xenorhabdus szentirmaii DSM 16338 TaxID=1427518 RepID=W1ISG1_9GAMM|nr:hypothetical protein XSR1_10042 [Xenorhabdus szentirmaii DSM 16338]